MSETTNYRLPLTNDNTTKFLDWRNSINGPGDSAMNKIDNVLAEKADNSRAIIVTLYADRWVNEGTISTQELLIEGLTEEQNGVIGAAQNLTAEELGAVRAAGLYINEQKEGALTIASDGETPQCNIPVVLILIG